MSQDSKLLLSVVKDVISTVIKMDPEPILKTLPLSNNTIQRNDRNY